MGRFIDRGGLGRGGGVAGRGCGRRRSIAGRRGSAYLLVLSCSLIVLTAGLAAVAVQRVRLATTGMQRQADTARRESQSALEWATQTISQDPSGYSWRTGASQTLNRSRGTLGNVDRQAIRVFDPTDGDLTDSVFDPVVIRVSTLVGPAKQSYQLALQPESWALPCMDFAVCASGGIVNAGKIQAVGGVRDGGTSRECSTTSVDAMDVLENQDTASPAVCPPRSTSDVTMPGADIFSQYAAAGTRIVPSGGEIRRCVLSATSNPFGARDPEGVYVWDAGGATVKVEECRIVGTLVILNAGAGSRIRGPISIAAFKPGRPALVLRGNFLLELGAQDLEEGAAGVNFNPPGTPFMSASDADTSDRYATVINGVVYVEGSTKISAPAAINGALLVEGVLEAADALYVKHVASPDPSPSFWVVRKFTAPQGAFARVPN